MRLLRLNDDGTIGIESFSKPEIPKYAILSHTWGREQDEVIFQDIQNHTGDDKVGYQKLTFCGRQAKEDSLHYFWVDTCCIDKSSEMELRTAINSMFRWYQQAEKCYVYLSDVSTHTKDGGIPQAEWESAFRKSRWFTRGWTLQELLAPEVVVFYSCNLVKLGDKVSLVNIIHETTGIAVDALQGKNLSSFTNDERFKWIDKRQTTEAEDIVYCLIGIFDISLLPIYGEGRDKAMKRLLREFTHTQLDESGGHEPHSTDSSLFSYHIRFLRSLSMPLTNGKERENEISRLKGQMKKDNESEEPSIHGSQPTDCTFSCYHIPFLRNKKFVGRSSVLQQLTQKLFIERKSPKCAIVGLGGIGKTQVALEFAYLVKSSWPELSIFWIPALSMESVEQACGEIARICDIQLTSDNDDVKELVKQHLSGNTQRKWLLIVDNADDKNLLYGSGGLKGIADYLPLSENGLILFTTRYQEVAVLLESDVVEMDEMTQKEAVSFFEKSLFSNSLARKQLLDHEAVAMDLFSELAHLPLAIAQAAAYLNSNKNLDIAGYLQLLQSTEHDSVAIFSHEFRDSTRYQDENIANAIAKTWLVSFDQIRVLNLEAARILSFISCIEWKAIPRSILPLAESEERTVRAIGILCGYSFITKRGDEEVYDTHRLVHLAIRIWVAKYGTPKETAEKAIHRVWRVFPETPTHYNRLIWRSYLTHALQLLKTNHGIDMEARHRLELRVGLSLWLEGRREEALTWFNESYQWNIKNLPPEHDDRLLSRQWLARAYQAEANYDKAIRLCKRTLIVCFIFLAQNDIRQFEARVSLAGAYLANDQMKKGIKMLERALKMRSVAPEDHPHRLWAELNLGHAYIAAGQTKKAVKMMEHAVAVRSRTQAEDNPDRLEAQHGLARSYLADGQIEKAVKLHEQVVLRQATVIAEDHQEQLLAQHSLANAYKADGQNKKREELLQHIVATLSKRLRPSHPWRLEAESHLREASEAA